MPKTVAFHTLGCKLNFSETSSIARLFEQEGYEKVTFEKAADVYVINTCSVTVNADKECHSIVRNALSLNPEAFVAVIGCYAQLKPNEIASIPGVDVVLGANEKFNLTNYINQAGKNTTAEVHHCDINDTTTFIGSQSTGDRTRTFLKVQDGCDYSCTFCTIPLARGGSRSDTIENVVRRANMLSEQGVKEIVLTGVNLGDFGFGTDISRDGRKVRHENFTALVSALDDQTNVERYRISSIEPNLLTDEVISTVGRSPRFANHFHIPLQSGSNQILAAMKRRYKRELYADRVSRIHEMVTDCCIGVDVITGFPGETDELFDETYRFLQELNIAYLHVFTYSERDNTEAAGMAGAVPIHIRRMRTKMLRNLSVKKQRAFYESQVGKPATVLFESEIREGHIQGYSSNYVRVKVPYAPELVNRLTTLSLENILEDGTVSAKMDELTTA